MLRRRVRRRAVAGRAGVGRRKVAGLRATGRPYPSAACSRVADSSDSPAAADSSARRTRAARCTPGAGYSPAAPLGAAPRVARAVPGSVRSAAPRTARRRLRRPAAESDAAFRRVLARICHADQPSVCAGAPLRPSQRRAVENSHGIQARTEENGRPMTSPFQPGQNPGVRRVPDSRTRWPGPPADPAQGLADRLLPDVCGGAARGGLPVRSGVPGAAGDHRRR